MDEIAKITSDLTTLRRVVLARVELDSSDYGLCPFHGEKTKSFHIFVTRTGRALYYCHGCYEKGDVINFVRHFSQLSFGEAIKKIGKITDQSFAPITYSPSPQRPKQGIGCASEEFCEKDCQRYAALREDYEILLEENLALREKLELPNFLPGEKKPWKD